MNRRYAFSRLRVLALVAFGSLFAVAASAEDNMKPESMTADHMKPDAMHSDGRTADTMKSGHTESGGMKSGHMGDDAMGGTQK